MNDKRIIKRLMTMAMVLVMSISCMGISASAVDRTIETPPAGTVYVRVNGERIEFPDQAPYVNSDNRTLIPVRFVAEELGAEVTWDNATRTATIKKDGITIKLPIGSKNMTVIANGETRTVTMDTEAVITGNRTMVPIRFVAEALGAYVDYSDAFRVVGIYSDILTAEEIATLRAFDYSMPRNALTYDEYDGSRRDDLYGLYRHTFGNFANSHEYLYHSGNYLLDSSFNDLGKVTDSDTEAEFYDLLIAEAAAELGYNSEELVISFRADQSCIYQPDDTDYVNITIRGIVTVTINRDWTYELSNAGGILYDKLDLPRRPKNGVPTEFYIDVHMHILPTYNVYVNNCVVLGEKET